MGRTFETVFKSLSNGIHKIKQFASYLKCKMQNTIHKYKHMKETPTIIIFNVDYTLGCFDDIYFLYYWITNHLDPNIQSILNDDISRLLKHYFSPNIFDIFRYLAECKENRKIKSVVLYSNNIYGRFWVNEIATYINKVLCFPLIGDIISSFTVINPLHHESDFRRKKHVKSYHDVSNILKLRTKHKIINIDCMYYSEMDVDNVYTIRLKPYYIYKSLSVIIENLLYKIAYYNKDDLFQKLFNNMHIDYQVYKKHVNNEKDSITKHDIIEFKYLSDTLSVFI